jgi:hypothetical protein
MTNPVELSKDYIIDSDGKIYPNSVGTAGAAGSPGIQGIQGIQGPAGASGGGISGYILLGDVKASATHGGTFTNGSWVKRAINTEIQDTGNHSTIATDQITLLPGTYRAKISCPAQNAGGHIARLQNVTDGVTIDYGTNEYSVSNVSTRTHINTRFTISATKTFEIQHRCTTTAATAGLGSYVGFAGISEYYTIAEFIRE